MKRKQFLIAVLIVTLTAVPAMAMQGHDGHGSSAGKGLETEKAMDHSAHGANSEHSRMGGTFKHTTSEGGIEAEFQVMRLASMNMTSDKGETHHIMVNLRDAESGAPIKSAVGKIKVIAPDKTEQVSPLKNYSGILAANFTFTASGKYGVICLLKNKDRQQVFKFWYEHM